MGEYSLVLLKIDLLSCGARHAAIRSRYFHAPLLAFFAFSIATSSIAVARKLYVKAFAGQMGLHFYN
jgi:hypothetical protein